MYADMDCIFIGINIQPNFRAATDPDELPSKRWHAKHPPREKEDVVVIPEWQAPDTAPSLPVQPVAAQPIVSSSYSQPAVSSNGAATTTTTAGPTATTSNSNQVTTTSPPPISGSSGGAVSSTYLFVSNGTTLTATNVQYPRGANGTNVTVPITFTVRNGTITNPEITGVLFTGCSGEMSAFSWSPVAWVYTLLLPLVLFAM